MAGKNSLAAPKNLMAKAKPGGKPMMPKMPSSMPNQMPMAMKKGGRVKRSKGK